MKSSAIHKSVCFQKRKEKKVQKFSTYIQYRIKMNNGYCAISELAQFQGCKSLKKAVSEVNTYTLNNIPSALLERKQVCKQKDFCNKNSGVEPHIDGAY